MPLRIQKNARATLVSYATVIENGMCIGCGVCAIFEPQIKIEMDSYGRYRAANKGIKELTSKNVFNCVCPFADDVPNEDVLAKEIFGVSVPVDPNIGYSTANYAGWVIESDFQKKGSSGGLVTWLLVELLSMNLVDYVVHVSSVEKSSAENPLFRYKISSSVDQIKQGVKSKYYPVEMSEVLQHILDNPGRYVIVAVPCFIKAIRLASRESKILKERLIFTVGLICGHLKSKSFSELLAWQCGVKPANLSNIDFRTKSTKGAASNYAVTVIGEINKQRVTIVKNVSELYGSNWGHGFFKYKACDFCDDVFGETADISIGDAWIREYESNNDGVNVVVVRSVGLNDILYKNAKNGRLHLDMLSAEKVAESQAGGLRHRREGLSYRLFLEDIAGNWRPQKRVEAFSSHLTKKLRRVYSMRYAISNISHTAFSVASENDDLNYFYKVLKPLTERYDHEYRRSVLTRVLSKIKRLAISFCK